MPTRSQTWSRYDVLANGLGYSFEHFDKAADRHERIFLFGDTFAYGTYDGEPEGAAYVDPGTGQVVFPASSQWNYHGKDPFAWSTTTDPNRALNIHFFMDKQTGLPLFVVPVNADGVQAVPTGGDDIPNSGISVGGHIYIVYSSGSEPTCTPQPLCTHANNYSVLVRYDPASDTFPLLRPISYVAQGGHFVFTSMHDYPLRVGPYTEPTIVIFGVGHFRDSDVYLAIVPRKDFETLKNVRYFVGLSSNNTPIWTDLAPSWNSDAEAAAQPVVTDDQQPSTIGNVSVSYVEQLGVWLMTYDAADQTGSGAGRNVFFRYAPEPWGPWSAAQTIYDPCADGGFGTFIHAGKGSCAVDPSTPGPAGPMAGEEQGNNPSKTPGTVFAPYMIERFSRVSGDTLTIDFTMSTWNPYTVVRMESSFTILHIPQPPPIHGGPPGV
ncbi:MAG TPA: DUF4185 domain-containing protein [Thermoanaerobaculaceae bacterium]|nr:DUF4185 domain-containing protein [Thermoanaerobaculaceae bacterium]